MEIAPPFFLHKKKLFLLTVPVYSAKVARIQAADNKKQKEIITMEIRRNHGMMGRILMSVLASVGMQHKYKLSAPPAEAIVPRPKFRATIRPRLTFGGSGKTKKINRLHLSKKAKLRRRRA